MTGDQEQETAAVLRTLLTVIPPTGSNRDKRIRRAMAAAAKALDRGRDPRAAVAARYRDRD